jgi:acetyl esterase/lipase
VTGAALVPPPRSWQLGQVVWRLSMQANELPFVVAAWVLAATGLAAGQGQLDDAAGLAVAGLALLTLAGLAVVTARALRAAPVAARAVADGLPGSPPAGAGGRRPWLRLLLLPLAVRRRDVVRRKNLSYGPAGRANLLDLYQPRSGTASGPCLVYLHGGGYRSGRKSREARALVYRLASQGWLCVSANYRLAGQARYPAALVDAKRVIAWLHEQAPEYGADPSSVTVAGSSAGAHLAAMAALTPGVAGLQPGFEAADTSVTAAVCLYGFYGSPGWIECEPGAASSPVDEVGDSAPPMLVAHGTHDSFASVAGAREFVDRFSAVAPHRPLVYVELPGAQHTFDLYHSLRFDAVLGAVEAFLAAVSGSAV